MLEMPTLLGQPQNFDGAGVAEMTAELVFLVMTFDMAELLKP
ncbi:hypothetical protein QO004_002093 [Rhizobium mesoamericanum]|nr:hypothetical protein [Rhizobium mesoamericanum]MDQ0560311.1 hypothetical protein [Rhizobium mesoamericanum]